MILRKNVHRKFYTVVSDQRLPQAELPEHVDDRLHRRLVDDGDGSQVHDLPELQRRPGRRRGRHDRARPGHWMRRLAVVGEQDQGVRVDAFHPGLGQDGGPDLHELQAQRITKMFPVASDLSLRQSLTPGTIE